MDASGSDLQLAPELERRVDQCVPNILSQECSSAFSSPKVVVTPPTARNVDRSSIQWWGNVLYPVAVKEPRSSGHYSSEVFGVVVHTSGLYLPVSLQ